MQVMICSRHDVEEWLQSGGFPLDTAVISFYDPPSVAAEGYRTLDYSGVVSDVMYIGLPDLDWFAYGGAARLTGGLFPEADACADFILNAAKHSRIILCQCEYGKSRSAGCAEAIMEYFYGNGKGIFSDPRYYPNHLVYSELLRTLHEKGDLHEKGCLLAD